MRIKFDNMRWYEISSFSTSVDANECVIQLHVFGGINLNNYIQEFTEEVSKNNIQTMLQGTNGELTVFFKDTVEIKSMGYGS